MTSTIARVGERGGIPLTRNKRVYLFTINISSYAAGGEVLTPATLGIKRIDQVQVIPSVPTTAANRDSVMSWDKANAKLFVCVMSTGVEAGALNLGTYELLVIGR